MKITVKDIAINGIIAALYVVLTLITYPLSFEGIQFRFAEVLMLLVFFRKDYTIGLCVGCALANLFSPLGLIDAGFGTLATLLACIVLCFTRWLWVGALAPVVFNAFIVALEISMVYDIWPEYWITCAQVAIGELAVMAVGYVIVMIFKHRSGFMKLIRAKQNLEFKL